MWDDSETMQTIGRIESNVHAALIFDAEKRETILWYRGKMRTPVPETVRPKKRWKGEAPLCLTVDGTIDTKCAQSEEDMRSARRYHITTARRH